MNILRQRTMHRVTFVVPKVKHVLKMSTGSSFDVNEFINDFYGSSAKGNLHFKGGYDFRWEQMYKFYAKYSSKWDNSTARLLEFGGGPVVTPLISAVPYVNQITFSAYLDSERKEVELWKQRKEGARDWSSHFQYVVNEVEHTAGDNAWREREELLRKRITNIVPCDALSDKPLLVEQEPYEIISTSLCLEPACTSQMQYKEAIKRLVGLLKPGGFFLMLIPERTTFYKVGKIKLPCLYVTLEQAKEALHEAGMAILITERDPVSIEQMQNPITVDKKAYAFVATHKVEF